MSFFAATKSPLPPMLRAWDISNFFASKICFCFDLGFFLVQKFVTVNYPWQIFTTVKLVKTFFKITVKIRLNFYCYYINYNIRHILDLYKYFACKRNTLFSNLLSLRKASLDLSLITVSLSEGRILTTMDESRLNLEKTAKQTESRLVNHETIVLRLTLQSGQKNCRLKTFLFVITS